MGGLKLRLFSVVVFVWVAMRTWSECLRLGSFQEVNGDSETKK